MLQEPCCTIWYSGLLCAGSWDQYREYCKTNVEYDKFSAASTAAATSVATGVHNYDIDTMMSSQYSVNAATLLELAPSPKRPNFVRRHFVSLLTFQYGECAYNVGAHFAFITILMSELKKPICHRPHTSVATVWRMSRLVLCGDNIPDNAEPLCYKLDEATTHRDRTAHKLFKLL